MSDFGVPVVDFVWNGVEGHDLLHEQGGNSGSKETDKDIMVHDAGASNIALESGNITLQGWGELSIFLDHALDRESKNSVSSYILVFEGCLELSQEVIPGSKGYSGTNNGFLWKVLAQVRVDPLVMYEKAKAIFLASVSYNFSLTAR